MILFPDDSLRTKWDIFITILLIFTSIITPYRIAFYEVDVLSWKVVDYVVDACFAIDIIMNFFSAYYDGNDELIYNKKTIAIRYISSWFFIDFISILPFSLILDSGNFAKLARIARLPKLYRLIKMTKLARVFKILKERSNVSKYLNDVLKLNVELERMSFFMLLFFIFCHITACFWVIIANLEERNPNTWIVLSDL